MHSSEFQTRAGNKPCIWTRLHYSSSSIAHLLQFHIGIGNQAFDFLLPLVPHITVCGMPILFHYIYTIVAANNAWLTTAQTLELLSLKPARHLHRQQWYDPLLHRRRITGVEGDFAVYGNKNAANQFTMRISWESEEPGKHNFNICWLGWKCSCFVAGKRSLTTICGLTVSFGPERSMFLSHNHLSFQKYCQTPIWWME